MKSYPHPSQGSGDIKEKASYRQRIWPHREKRTNFDILRLARRNTIKLLNEAVIDVAIVCPGRLRQGKAVLANPRQIPVQEKWRQFDVVVSNDP